MPFLAAALRASEWLSTEALTQAQEQAERTQHSFLQTVLNLAFVHPDQIATACAHFFEVAAVDLYNITIAPEIPDKIFAWIHQKKFSILPFAFSNNILSVAMSDPDALICAELLEFQFVVTTHIFFTNHSDLLHHLHHLQSGNRYQLLLSNAENNADSLVMHGLEEIISDAIHRRASDIHFEPFEYDFRVRMRIDGILHEIIKPPISMANAMSSAVKIMANLNIAERRLPQDGRFTFSTHKKMTRDCRVSICPTLFGEKIVIRILESSPSLLNIQELGMTETDQNIFLRAIERPQGLILVTGPTGSGKTVTLYTALSKLNSLERNISTIEDPVEIKLAGINQVNVNSAAGLHFATALRSFLRQDPDVIMIGEIRDQETAEIALKAAETGHLVLATLHTNSTIESIQRLKHMGIDTYSIFNSTLLIIAQRLLRKLCVECKQKNGDDEFFSAVGCAHCQNGYKGRTAVYELLPLCLEMKSGDFFSEENLNSGILEKWRICTLRDAAMKKARLGITSLEEVWRVT